MPQEGGTKSSAPWRRAGCQFPCMVSFSSSTPVSGEDAVLQVVMLPLDLLVPFGMMTGICRIPWYDITTSTTDISKSNAPSIAGASAAAAAAAAVFIMLRIYTPHSKLYTSSERISCYCCTIQQLCTVHLVHTAPDCDTRIAPRTAPCKVQASRTAPYKVPTCRTAPRTSYLVLTIHGISYRISYLPCLVFLSCSSFNA